VGALLRLLLVASVVVTGCSPAPAPQEEPEAPSLLGQFDWPDGVQFTGTTVGGLSGITYDAGRDVYYVISDDRWRRTRLGSTRCESRCRTVS
jgi:hypothetical protein